MKKCSNKSIYKNNPNYICNPITGKYVLKTRESAKKLIKKYTMLNHANQLEELGFTVLPLEWTTKTVLKNIRSDMLKTMNNFPEYNQNPEMFVLGGFSALCNPSSFHNPFVRSLRMCAMKELIPLFSEFINMLPNPSQWKLEQIIDRMLFRPAGISATAESWHRDEASLALDDDKIFGGWWNFDDYSQFFSCVPSTHTDVNGHSGFAPIKNKKDVEFYNKNKIKVEIPPGHIIIFYENIVHEVLSKKYKHDMYRLFLGWRLTKSKDPLYPVESRLENQDVMPLKSNQIPPMYATLHWTNWRNKIVSFTDNFKPICTESKKVSSGKDKDKTYIVVHKHMWSLKDYGFKLYPIYSIHEKNMHIPNTEWKLKCSKGYKIFKLHQ